MALLVGGVVAAVVQADDDGRAQRVAAGGSSTASVAPTFELDTATTEEAPVETTLPPTTEPVASSTTAPPRRARTGTSLKPPATVAPTLPPVTTVVADVAPTTTTRPSTHFYDPSNRASSPPGPSAFCDRAVAFADVSPRIAASGVYTASNGTIRKLVSGTNGGTWSADRRRIAYQAPDDRGLSADLCVLDVADRSAKRITAVMYADGGSYAPGGSELWARDAVVVNDDGSADHLVAVATDTGAKTKITKPAAFDVSPDGTRVAVLEPMDSADRHLHVHDLLHGTARDLPIVRKGLAPYGVRWIDDRTVAFGNGDLLTKDVETGVETVVIAQQATPLGGWAFSSRTQRFAITVGGYQESAEDGLYTVRRDGNERRFVRNDRTLMSFAWSPDGASLLAVHGDPRNGQTLRLDPLDDRPPTTIASSDAGYGFVLRDGWSPDGSTLEFSVMHYRFG